MSRINRWALVAERCIEVLNKLVVIIVILVIVGLSFSVSYEVVMRYFFNSPTDWVTEVSTWSLIFIFFLPIAYAEQLGQHIKVDIFTIRASKRTQAGLAVATSALSLFVFVIFAWSGTLYAQERLDWNTGPPLEMPLFPYMVAIPVGLILLSLQIFVSLIKNITAFLKALDNNPSSLESG